MPAHPDLSAMAGRADDVRSDATRHLTALAGDASMCAIGRSGRSFPAAKYHEGRQAAASQARRLLRQPDVPSHVPADPLADIVADWRRRAEQAPGMGPDWVAYAAGGLDALAQITGDPALPTFA